ncbi:transcriptional regulator [Photobacterium frigidiphilum]|uniref:Transcriptional regulator n=1 Tax=Photobacterium frigidiphilum TaxID=264736 RepID=A0A2T3JK98_9GAMM|nr:helix-turn-helix transcriptional regulator [Photobacterium frigidiphilum]PSU49453.1 transcriptional regulator [Photobacterium frigidiphilum]
MCWIEALKTECEQHGQAEISRRIGYSKAVISQVLNGKYSNGNIERVRERVEGALLGKTVDCPMLGDITLDVCQSHQNRKFSVTNPMRVQMYRSCRSGCPHSSLCKGE